MKFDVRHGGKDYFTRYYAQLSGLTVISIKLENNNDGGDPYPVLLMGRDDGNGGVYDNTLLWVIIQRDPSGGAGYAAIHKIGTEQ